MTRWNSSEQFSEWLRQSRHEGSDEAWGRLLEPYRGYLRLLAEMQLTPQLRRKVGESDLVQETFLRAHRFRATFKGINERQLGAWLRGILASRLAEQFEHFQAQVRDLRREVDWEVALDESSRSLTRFVKAPKQSPSAALESMEQEIEVGNALAMLKDDYRHVIIMRFVEGRQLAEVVEITGWTADRVQKLTWRGLATLRKHLQVND